MEQLEPTILEGVDSADIPVVNVALNYTKPNGEIINRSLQYRHVLMFAVGERNTDGTEQAGLDELHAGAIRPLELYSLIQHITEVTIPSMKATLKATGTPYEAIELLLATGVNLKADTEESDGV